MALLNCQNATCPVYFRHRMAHIHRMISPWERPSDDLDKSSEKTGECLFAYPPTDSLVDMYDLFKSMNLSLRYNTSNTTRHNFKAVSKIDTNRKWTVNIIPFPKFDGYGKMDDPARPENVEIRLTDLLASHNIPFLANPIFTLKADISKFVAESKNVVCRDQNLAY